MWVLGTEVKSILFKWQVLYRLSDLPSPRNDIFFFCPNFQLSIWEHRTMDITLLWEQVLRKLSACVQLWFASW